jgi:tetratricopeptide (TPR) repeat protein
MKLLRVARIALLVCAAAAPLAAQTAGAPQTAPPAAPTVDQGLAALNAGQPAQALAIFQQILATDPNNAVADLYAATAALVQDNGPLAVQYAEKARQLDPQSWKIHTTLVAAYAAAGMKQQRDDERAILAKLHTTGAPDAREAHGFLLEIFKVGPAQVSAIQYFEPVGKFHTYYRFLIRAGEPVGAHYPEIDVQSNDFDEKSWEQTHAAEAAQGERHFQLTDASGTTDYRTFAGKPDYDQIRAMVVSILETQAGH